MIDFLQNEWQQLASKFSKNDGEIDALWKEIKTQYQLKTKHYHSLSHINSMIIQAKENEQSIEDYDAFLFAIWYHDIVYKASKKDNENQSARFAEKRLKTLNIKETTSITIQKLIVSTKNHQIILNKNRDNAFLLDIDLSILGSDWATYQEYTQNIRNEYNIYPNFIYNKGRKQILKQFLNRDTLFFTEKYQLKFENQARQNILREIEQL
ncbi:hypothetical protein [Algibacter sp. Ld11]|uniref:HD domain-containing protein n=1 Tax=Algibacter sp. Ld11 TaxID=649150 RepID=UPI0038659C9F